MTLNSCETRPLLTNILSGTAVAVSASVVTRELDVYKFKKNTRDILDIAKEYSANGERVSGAIKAKYEIVNNDGVLKIFNKVKKGHNAFLIFSKDAFDADGIGVDFYKNKKRLFSLGDKFSEKFFIKERSIKLADDICEFSVQEYKNSKSLKKIIGMASIVGAGAGVLRIILKNNIATR